MAESDSLENLSAERVTLNIRHHVPEGLQLTFADNVAVQHTPTEFVMTFAQTYQPLIFEEQAYRELTEIRADVVARIVLTPPKMLELIQALQTNWAHYERRLRLLMEERNAAAANAADTAAADSTKSDDNK